MKKKSPAKKIIKYSSYKKKWNLNIGIIMFGFIFSYLLVVIFRYVTDENLNVYEVREGSIINDTVYAGVALRNEKVVKSKESGYIQFYYPELSRVSIGQNIYTLSKNELTIEQTESNNLELTELEKNDIKGKIQQFNSTYTENNFSDVYRLKGELQSIINLKDTHDKINNLNEISDLYNQKIYNSTTSGILLYELDGYELLNEGELTQDHFDKNAYTSKIANSGQEISKDDYIYKVVVDEVWNLYINLDNSDINTLKNIQSLDVKFMKDDVIVPAKFNIVQINGFNYGKLEFNEGMVRYATERFLDIELLISNLEGYKIPNSSVVQNTYYTIPVEYITKGGNSSSDGVLIKDNSDLIEFKSLPIFFKDEHYYYVSVKNLELNTVIIAPDTNESYIISDSRNLYGVYNVNRGYAILKYVNIINTSDEYHIVENLPYYSINNYDYIALYGYKINQGDLVN